MEKFYITTTIPYVNAPPHIGHALEFVQADVIARSRRIAGDKVYFLSGTDENAIKNVQAAESEGIPVEEFVVKNSDAFKGLLAALGISNNDFIRTTEERHKKGAQALWKATNPDDIYKKTYTGLYCVGCELFYKPEELDENGECFEHPGKKLEQVEEENYFFRLSKYSSWLQEILTSNELTIVPDTRKNEILMLIKQGLEDFSISRPVSRSKGWGVPVPEDPSQTMYVWYDALANYITALGYPDENAELYRNFWGENPNRFHILGKGVSRFHAIYWPAMLKSAGLPIPAKEFIHGYVTVNGQKMSKTLGNVVDPILLVDKYGTDAVRYYLLREISAYEDGDFSEEKFKERYNADLANDLGNSVSRIMQMAKTAEMRLSINDANRTINDWVDNPDASDPIFPLTYRMYKEAIDRFDFRKALEIIWNDVPSSDDSIKVIFPTQIGGVMVSDTTGSTIAHTSGYIQQNEPWKNREKIPDLLKALQRIALLLEPFLPETAKAIKNSLITGNPIGSLFPRLEK